MPINAAGQWSPDLFPKQVQAMAACRPSNRNLVLLNGPRWSSKCVSEDTLVYTADGILPIGRMGHAQEDLFVEIDIEVASMKDGGIGVSKASHYYNSGVKAGFSIKTALGYELVCSKRHPIWTECNGQIGYRTADEINELFQSGQDIWFPMIREHKCSWPEKYQTVDLEWFEKQERRKHEASQRVRAAMRGGAKKIGEISTTAKAGSVVVHKYWKKRFKPRRAQISVDCDIAYLMGLFVGDGCYTAGQMLGYGVKFSTLDPSILDAARITLSKHFGASMIHIKGCDYSVGNSASFRAFLVKVGMAGKYSYEKDIPDVIFRSPRDVAVSFLQGLFDTDGTAGKEKGGSSYCTTSLLLSKHVQQLLLALGIRASRIFRSNDYRGAWQLCPRREDGFAEKVGFRLARKQQLTNTSPNYRRSYSSYPPSFIAVLRSLHKSRRVRGVGNLSRKTHKHVIDSVLRGNAALSKKRLSPLLDALACRDHQDVGPYWMNGEIWWDKLDSISPTETKLVDIAVPGTNNFIGNGFICHNTFCCHHIVCDHAWNTDRADICVLSFTQSVGIDSGIWQHLTEIFIPEWIGGKDNKGNDFGGRFGMKWEKKPHVMNVTKKPACSIVNKHGTISKISLQSLRLEDDVEEIFKSRSFSMIWVNELSKFKKRKTFDTLKQCLRMPHLKTNQHLFLADTNPDLDLGTGSPWYELWYGLASMGDDCPMDLRPLRDSLRVIEFTVDDNLSLSMEKKAQLRADFAHDPDLMAAYYWGKWVTASADALFYGVFKPNIHVVGDPDTPAIPNPEIMVPSEGCYELIGGLDPGARNCAAVILEKATLVRDKREIPAFAWLDEHVVVGEDFSLEDWIEQLVTKMDFWEKVMKKPGKVIWRWWSDRSVFDTKIPFTEKYWHEFIYDLSGGRITCMAAERGRGSVGARVDFFRKLIWEERLRVSKNRCPHGIQMIQSIRRGRGRVIIPTQSPWKHSFDSVTYPIVSECYDELQRSVIVNLRKQNETEESGLIQVAL